MLKIFCWFLTLLCFHDIYVKSMEHRLVYPAEQKILPKDSSEESENHQTHEAYTDHRRPLDAPHHEIMHHDDAVTFDERSRNANEGSRNWRHTNRESLREDSFNNHDRADRQREFGASSSEHLNTHETAPQSANKKRRRHRLCEQKYMEYMTRIFHDEDTVADGTDSDFNGRVLAEPGQYPHMSALGFTEPNQPIDYKCGGSLISEHFVVTAAHCTDFMGEKPTKVRIGDLNLMVEERYLQPQIRNIKRIHNHPDYQTTSYYNDIALLELDEGVELTEFVRPIRLWTDTNISANTVAHAMGYGATAFGKAPTRRLTDLNLTIVSNTDCNNEMPEMPETPSGIISSQICAKDFVLNRDTCQGDSGGPLQLNLRGRRRRNRQHYHLVGITSYGQFCRSTYPSVYTRITSFLDWIEEIVWQNP